MHRPTWGSPLGLSFNRCRGIPAALVLTAAVVKAKSATHSPVSLAKRRSIFLVAGVGVQSFLGACRKASRGLDSSVGGLTV